MTTPIAHTALDQIFHNARTFTHWQDRAVPDELLKQLFDLLKLGPTSANCSPARFLFVKSAAAKARLRPCLDKNNVEKTMSAPVTAIVAMDKEFYEFLPKLLPRANAKSWFEGKQDLIDATAFRNSSLQGAYLIIAARSLGLDCGPMSGFNADMLNAEFFPDGRLKANFLVNLGYGDASTLHPRAPRFDFNEACQVL
jgi:3-hydroxypropanoate dehydrogenase